MSKSLVDTLWQNFCPRPGNDRPDDSSALSPAGEGEAVALLESLDLALERPQDIDAELLQAWRDSVARLATPPVGPVAVTEEMVLAAHGAYFDDDGPSEVEMACMRAALEAALAASPSDVDKLRAEVERLTKERDMYEQMARSKVVSHKDLQTESLEARVSTLTQALEFVARMAWRTDPPNAANKLTDSERLSAIKHHPTVKELGKPHIELAERETLNTSSGEVDHGDL